MVRPEAVAGQKLHKTRKGVPVCVPAVFLSSQLLHMFRSSDLLLPSDGSPGLHHILEVSMYVLWACMLPLPLDALHSPCSVCDRCTPRTFLKSSGRAVILGVRACFRLTDVCYTCSGRVISFFPPMCPTSIRSLRYPCMSSGPARSPSPSLLLSPGPASVLGLRIPRICWILSSRVRGGFPLLRHRGMK